LHLGAAAADDDNDQTAPEHKFMLMALIGCMLQHTLFSTAGQAYTPQMDVLAGVGDHTQCALP
jgi:hypothetical protein